MVENENPTLPVHPLVYGPEDRPPLGSALLVAGQQVAAMAVGVVTPALILSGVLKFSQTDTAYLVSMALMAAAVGTFLQTSRFGPVGSGLLSVTGTSFAFLQPLIQAGQLGGLPLMFGMSLAGAPVQILLAPFMPRLRRLFPPLISGIVVLLIGLSIIPEAVSGITAPTAPGAPVWSGAIVALVVIGAVLLTQAVGLVWARLTGILFGVIVGYLVCALCGWWHPPPSGGEWFTVPRLLPHGFAFRASLLFPFAFIYLVSLLEALGDMTATAQLSGLKAHGPTHASRLRGGLLADGLTSMIAALFGSFPSTTYAQNNGVIQITGVASRHIGKWMALMLLALGVFPVVGHWVTAMPPSVLGGMALLLFGLVSVSGLRLIVAGHLNHRDGLIVALALGVGLGAPSQTEWLAHLPAFCQGLLDSGISAGGITAILLNLLLPGGQRVVDER
jgi:xanthine permease XanP